MSNKVSVTSHTQIKSLAFNAVDDVVPERKCKHCPEPAAEDRWECNSCKARIYREKKLLNVQSAREKELERKLEEMTLSRDEVLKEKEDLQEKVRELENRLAESSVVLECRGCLEDQPNQLAHCDPLTGCLRSAVTQKIPRIVVPPRKQSLQVLQDSISLLTLEDSSECSAHSEASQAYPSEGYSANYKAKLYNDVGNSTTRGISPKGSSILTTTRGAMFCAECGKRVWSGKGRHPKDPCVCTSSEGQYHAGSLV